MKISVIHNLYEKNKWVNESVQYNVIALENANIDYQYTAFNRVSTFYVIDINST